MPRRLKQQIPAFGHGLTPPPEIEGGRRPFSSVHRLHERLREGAAEAERLADRAHLAAEPVVRFGELREVEARRFHCDVVECGLERRGRLLRDVVWELVERV